MARKLPDPYEEEYSDAKRPIWRNIMYYPLFIVFGCAIALILSWVVYGLWSLFH